MVLMVNLVILITGIHYEIYNVPVYRINGIPRYALNVGITVYVYNRIPVLHDSGIPFYRCISFYRYTILPVYRKQFTYTIINPRLPV